MQAEEVLERARLLALPSRIVARTGGDTIGLKGEPPLSPRRPARRPRSLAAAVHGRRLSPVRHLIFAIDVQFTDRLRIERCADHHASDDGHGPGVCLLVVGHRQEPRAIDAHAASFA
jgi:hypothetical protein